MKRRQKIKKMRENLREQKLCHRQTRHSTRKTLYRRKLKKRTIAIYLQQRLKIYVIQIFKRNYPIKYNWPKKSNYLNFPIAEPPLLHTTCVPQAHCYPLSSNQCSKSHQEDDAMLKQLNSYATLRLNRKKFK